MMMSGRRTKHEKLLLIITGCCAVFPHFVISSYNIAKGKKASQSSIYNIHWGADKAVDGVIGRDVTGGHCSSTNPEKSAEAWWIVDLQQMSRIKTINIIYRQEYPFRLSGFYLYVSNMTVSNTFDIQPDRWHLCYHDETTYTELPSVNQSRPCPVDGQYVIFYNKRPADEPKTFPKYSPGDAVVELCEVQVFGCPVNTFGRSCERHCYCETGGCDPDTGVCDVGGCQSGWMGQSCSEGCGNGKFGMNCNQTCHCLQPGCDSKTGRCMVQGCEAGWQDVSCDQRCDPRHFGRGCKNECHCDMPGCNTTNGLCNKAGCEAGWKGTSCDKVCSIGHFGKDCKQLCHCDNSGCTGTNGVCYSAGCKAGWKGQSCNKACDIGTYGKNCISTCNCATPGCDVVSGNCNVPGCKNGWKGSTCDIACNISSFGSNCDNICHCAKPGCDRFTGLCNITECEVGWFGSSCDQVGKADNTDGPPSLGGIIGGVCAVLVAAIVIIIITVIMIRRKRQNPSDKNVRKSTKHKSTSITAEKRNDDKIYVNMASIEETEIALDVEDKNDEPQGDTKDEVDAEEEEVIYINNPLRTPVIAKTKINITDLRGVIARKHRDNAFANEYQSLPHGLVHPHETSKAPDNIIRNRFKTTFAYDHSRVVLRKEKEGLSDYINANCIQDTEGIKAYIATQGPKVTTLEDFWRMVWQKECGKIIMLANLVELGKKKCTNYWKGEDSTSLNLGLYQVTLQEEMLYAFYTIRKLSVRNKQTNAKRHITQYHFTKWPDHGVPEAFELLQFHKRVQSGSTDLAGPLIVHCSAGIGRTGTYIGLDALLKDGTNKKEIDVFAYTKKMREDRMNMIQTLDQYIVLHEVLAEGLEIETKSMARPEISRNITNMLTGDILEKQLKVLENNRPHYKDKDVEAALTSTNKGKNKELSIPAVERFRVYLTSTTSDYINAVNIPSYRNQYGYILTQHPLHNTVVDFWSMVSQQDVDVIVSIGTPKGDARWPTKEGHSERFGDFTITYGENQQQTSKSDVVTQRKLSLTNKETPTTAAITILETSSWKGKLPSTKSMLELIQMVLTSKDSLTSPIIITCCDGSTESGLLCTLCNVVERLEVDGDVDIMAAVRQLQIRRPQILSDKMQYEFCYKVMKDHLEKGSVYANI